MTNDLRYAKELDAALRATMEAARLTGEVQKSLAPETLEKKDKSPVTIADFGSQALICRLLAEEFPGDPVMGEESSGQLRLPENAAVLDQVCRRVARHRPQADADTVCRWIDHGRCREYRPRFWTLDPVDGTLGFLRGGQYAIALALIVDGVVEAAALACPNLPARDGGAGLVLAAARGSGAREVSLAQPASSRPARVSAETDPSRLRLCEPVESGHSAHGRSAEAARRLGIVAEPLCLDSQAKYAAVARGDAHIYMRLPTSKPYNEKIWDHAAGALVSTEAGAVVSDSEGRPLDFARGMELSANRGIVVAAGAALHERVLQSLREASAR